MDPGSSPPHQAQSSAWERRQGPQDQDLHPEVSRASQSIRCASNRGGAFSAGAFVRSTQELPRGAALTMGVTPSCSPPTASPRTPPEMSSAMAHSSRPLPRGSQNRSAEPEAREI